MPEFFPAFRGAYVITRSAAAAAQNSAGLIADDCGGAGLTAIDTEKERHLHRVRDAGEGKIMRLHGGRNHSDLRSPHADVLADHRSVLQQPDNALREAEVHNGLA